MESFRHNLSAFVLRSFSLLLSLGGPLLLFLGLIFTAQSWWTLVHQCAGLWAISTATLEIFVLAVAFFSILFIPHIQYHGSDRKVSWKEEKRSGVKKDFSTTS